MTEASIVTFQIFKCKFIMSYITLQDFNYRVQQVIQEFVSILFHVTIKYS